MADLLCYLRSLSEPARTQLSGLLGTMPSNFQEHCVVKHLKKGQKLIDSLDHSEWIYVLTVGGMQAIHEMICGTVYVIAEFSPPAFLGEIELLAGIPYYRGTLLAKSDCELLMIQKEEYLAWIQQNSALLLDRARSVIQHLLTQSGNERNLLFWDGTKRLVFLLCQYYQKNEKDGVAFLSATRQEMADQIQASAKTVSRGLQFLSAQGFIQLQGRKVKVRQEHYQQLLDMLHEEDSEESKL